jgi:hypothetical protein
MSISVARIASSMSLVPDFQISSGKDHLQAVASRAAGATTNLFDYSG